MGIDVEYYDDVVRILMLHRKRYDVTMLHSKRFFEISFWEYPSYDDGKYRNDGHDVARLQKFLCYYYM